MHHFSLPVLFMMCVIHLHAQRNPAPNQVLTNPVRIKNLESVNTPGLEFSPAFYLNGIVFCSSGDEIPKPGEDNTFFELYYADATATGKLTRPRSFSSTLNSQLSEQSGWLRNLNRISLVRCQLISRQRLKFQTVWNSFV